MAVRWQSTCIMILRSWVHIPPVSGLIFFFFSFSLLITFLLSFEVVVIKVVVRRLDRARVHERLV